MPPTPRSATPKLERITIRCATTAISTLATIAIGSSGGRTVISARTQSGAAPPGAGSISTASPAQTKLIPSDTTIDGRLRRWITAPTAA